MPDATWYEEMGKAMSRRDKALNAITKWQATLAEVEAEIEALRTGEKVDQQPAGTDAGTSVDAEPGAIWTTADQVSLATQ